MGVGDATIHKLNRNLIGRKVNYRKIIINYLLERSPCKLETLGFEWSKSNSRQTLFNSYQAAACYHLPLSNSKFSLFKSKSKFNEETFWKSRGFFFTLTLILFFLGLLTHTCFTKTKSNKIMHWQKKLQN